MDGFPENFLNIVLEDVLLDLYQNNHLFTDCNELWDNIFNFTITLENEINNNNNINNNGNYSRELIITLKTYTYNTRYHFHKFVRSNKWFIKRFKEINGVFITLNHQVNNNQMLQNFDQVLNDIKILRILLITKHYDQLLLNTSRSIETDVIFTFGEIPFTFFDDDQIHNWRNQNLIRIYNKFKGYEEIGLRLMEMVDTIAYKIINCEEPNFQI
ncbi:hypothetical protein ACTFIT_002943 [Dictyostelium discoideum]